MISSFHLPRFTFLYGADYAFGKALQQAHGTNMDVVMDARSIAKDVSALVDIPPERLEKALDEIDPEWLGKVLLKDYKEWVGDMNMIVANCTLSDNFTPLISYIGPDACIAMMFGMIQPWASPIKRIWVPLPETEQRLKFIERELHQGDQGEKK